MEQTVTAKERPTYHEEHIRAAKDVVNGICAFMKREGWKEGYRNNMAVDLSCACKVIDIDPMYPIRRYIDNSYALRDAEQRIETIAKYADSWEQDNVLFARMTDPTLWKMYIPNNTEEWCFSY